MRAEILAVGTELLLGDIVNTNAAHISASLASIGVDVLYQTVVGDNEERIADEISAALERSDALIICGGLGPTHDDLTREAIARATGRGLKGDPILEEELRGRFEAMGRVMADANLKQTYLPQGARAIPNRRGTAPGVSLEVDGRRIYALPGVPHEMEGMLDEVVLPELAEASGGKALTSRVLKVVGMGESDAADRLGEAISDLDRDPVATIALLAGRGEVRVRITAKEDSGAAAAERIASVEERVRGILGSAVFGADDDTLESVVAGTMRGKGLSLAVAESVTGGMVASRIVNVPGASKFLIGGFVTYTPEMKESLLGVPEAVLSRGTVSAEAAEAMAVGARERTGADVGLSTTGEAGPDNEEAPMGTIYLGLAWDGGSLNRHFVAPRGRETVRRWATQGALNLLRLWLQGEANPD